MANEWLNTVQYPFVPQEFATGDGTMRYLDEGSGRPIVFLHGNPTWSYLYRHFIHGLSGSFRCIAPDLLGYGLSDKPNKVDYRPRAQARRFAGLMDVLGLDDVTLVVNCAGGPVALAWAIENPERVHSLVLFNTWLWPLLENRYAMRLSRLVSNPLNRFYYRALNASPSFILPALMLWGMKDPILGPEALARFESLFQNHSTRQFPQSGRFVPEESPQSAFEEIRWFLMNQ